MLSFIQTCIMLCALVILWAFEIRYKESLEELNNALDEIKKIQDEISYIVKKLKIVSDKVDRIESATP